MKTFDSAMIDRRPLASATIAWAGSSRPFEVELLAAGGIGAVVAYEGDASGCPHCKRRVLSDTPEVVGPEVVGPKVVGPEMVAPEVWAA